jgi:hypothetical protein
MTAPRVLALALAAVLTGTVAAQEAPAPNPAPAPAVPAMSHDCGPAARHDHGAERGMPAPRMAACPMAAPTPAAAAAPAAKPKARPGHDHARVHKLM